MDIAKLLENNLQCLKEARDEGSFTANLFDYLNYLVKTPEIKPTLNVLEKEKKEDYKKYFETKDKTYNELETSRKKLLKIIDANKIEIDALKNEISEQTMYKDGVRKLKIRELYERLYNIAIILGKNDKTYLIKNFINNSRKIEDLISNNLVFSKTYLLFIEEEKRIEELKKTRVWHCWYKLKFIPELLTLPFEEAFNNVKLSEEDGKYFIDAMVFKSRLENITGRSAGEKINEYKNYCQRLHNWVLQNLEAMPVEEKINLDDNKSNPFCEVDGKYGYLRFNKKGEKIKIGGKNTRPFKLLDCLLTNFGVARTIDSVFDFIKIDKDKNNQKLTDEYLKGCEQKNIITNAIKELQKDNKLRGKIKIEFLKNSTQIRAKYY